MRKRNKIALYIFKRKLTVKAGNFNRFKFEACGGNKLCLHFILCADKKYLGVGKSFAYFPCGGKSRIDVSARSAGGKNYSHIHSLRRRKPRRFPFVLFFHTFSSLHVLETESTTPISQNRMMSAVPP